MEVRFLQGVFPLGSSMAEQSLDKRPTVVRFHPVGFLVVVAQWLEQPAVNRWMGVRFSSVTPILRGLGVTVALSGFHPDGAGANPVARSMPLDAIWESTCFVNRQGGSIPTGGSIPW